MAYVPEVLLQLYDPQGEYSTWTAWALLWASSHGGLLGPGARGRRRGPCPGTPSFVLSNSLPKVPLSWRIGEDPAVSRPLLRLRLVEEARDTKGGLALSIFECGWLGDCGTDVEVGLGCPGP